MCIPSDAKPTLRNSSGGSTIEFPSAVTPVMGDATSGATS